MTRPALLTPTEAARRLGVSPRRLQQFVEAGRLRVVRLAGGGYVVGERELEAFAALPRPPGRPRKVE